MYPVRLLPLPLPCCFLFASCFLPFALCSFLRFDQAPTDRPTGQGLALFLTPSSLFLLPYSLFFIPFFKKSFYSLCFPLPLIGTFTIPIPIRSPSLLRPHSIGPLRRHSKPWTPHSAHHQHRHRHTGSFFSLVLSCLGSLFPLLSRIYLRIYVQYVIRYLRMHVCMYVCVHVCMFEYICGWMDGLYSYSTMCTSTSTLLSTHRLPKQPKKPCSHPHTDPSVPAPQNPSSIENARRAPPADFDVVKS